VRELSDQALNDASASDLSAAAVVLETGRAQLRGIRVSLQDAVDAGELADSSAQSLDEESHRAERFMYEAVTVLQNGKADIATELGSAVESLDKILLDLAS
jgi:hypothetical protein